MGTFDEKIVNYAPKIFKWGYLLALLLVLALLAHTWWRWSEKKKKNRRRALRGQW